MTCQKVGEPDNSEGFNEFYYLLQNPDVAAAVRAGQFNSGKHHFHIFGRLERREKRFGRESPECVDNLAEVVRPIRDYFSGVNIGILDRPSEGAALILDLIRFDSPPRLELSKLIAVHEIEDIGDIHVYWPPLADSGGVHFMVSLRCEDTNGQSTPYPFAMRSNEQPLIYSDPAGEESLSHAQTKRIAATISALIRCTVASTLRRLKPSGLEKSETAMMYPDVDVS